MKLIKVRIIPGKNYKSKFDDKDYLCPEDKSIKRFALKDEERILWRRINNQKVN